MEKENWFGRRLNAEARPEFIDERWVIYFEDYPYCPVVCANVEHALAVYDEYVARLGEGYMTYAEVCAEGTFDYRDIPLDKVEFLLGASGICGIPWSLTDEEFWEDEAVPNHKPL